QLGLVAVVAQFLEVEPDIAVGGLAQALAFGRVRGLHHGDDRRDIHAIRRGQDIVGQLWLRLNYQLGLRQTFRLRLGGVQVQSITFLCVSQNRFALVRSRF